MLKRNSNALALDGRGRWKPVSRWQSLAALGPVIYAIRLDGGVIKIGYTTKLPEREVLLRSQHGSKSSQVVGFAFGDYADEQAIHERLSDEIELAAVCAAHPTPEVLAVVPPIAA